MSLVQLRALLAERGDMPVGELAACWRAIAAAIRRQGRS